MERPVLMTIEKQQFKRNDSLHIACIRVRSDGRAVSINKRSRGFELIRQAFGD